MKNTRLAAVIGTLAITAAGLAALAGCGTTTKAPAASATPAATTPAAAATLGGSAYAYYQTMMKGLYGGGTMMGGGSYGWMTGATGYQWMMGGTAAPAWMRGSALPGFLREVNGVLGIAAFLPEPFDQFESVLQCFGIVGCRPGVLSLNVLLHALIFFVYGPHPGVELISALGEEGGGQKEQYG